MNAGNTDTSKEQNDFPQGRVQAFVGRRVVCAACRHDTGMLVLGARHWDELMITNTPDEYTEPSWWTQGFIDQRGEFLDRQEAWKVAHSAGQIIRRVGGDTKDGGTLYSENLY